MELLCPATLHENYCRPKAYLEDETKNKRYSKRVCRWKKITKKVHIKTVERLNTNFKKHEGCLESNFHTEKLAKFASESR